MRPFREKIERLRTIASGEVSGFYYNVARITLLKANNVRFLKTRGPCGPVGPGDARPRDDRKTKNRCDDIDATENVKIDFFVKKS